jgi:peptidoglycan/xylan/chitin deacetylase (PgdA/CDA1 family)
MSLRRLATLSIAACFFAASASNAQTTPPASSSGLPALSISGVPKPTGPVGNLKVLNWAGFHSAVTYTFDDSIPSQIANYPQLQATGVHMTFFLVGASDGNSPVWAQAAKDGHELGNHTEHHCHADSTGCGWGPYAGSLQAEYDLCTDHIERTYGVSSVWTTASPYGDMGYDNAAKTRFFLNRGVQGGQIAPNDNSDPFNLPIFGASAGQTAAAFNPAIDSAHAAGNWLIFMFHSLGGDGGYAPVDPAEVIASIHHAQSFGDTWIDSMVNIGAYWVSQKAVTNAISSKSGKDTMLTWTLPAHFPPGKYLRVTITGGTLKQEGKIIPWNSAGYYEVALDPGSLTISK